MGQFFEEDAVMTTCPRCGLRYYTLSRRRPFGAGEGVVCDRCRMRQVGGPQGKRVAERKRVEEAICGKARTV